jgi:integrase
MSVLLNHARRYDLYNRNPIRWVRQSAKRRSVPDMLTGNEVRELRTALEPRERIMVLLDVATGLRQSELFALKWKDVDFENRQLWVTRFDRAASRRRLQDGGFVKACAASRSSDQGPAKLATQNGLSIARELGVRQSATTRKGPILGQQLLRHHIRPAAQRVGIVKRIGWHTFRRTYSTLLRATGAELKVMQELMRHSTIRVTLDTYTQAVTTEKRAPQTAVVSLFLNKKGSKAT